MTSKREDREALITEAAEAILEAMGGIVPDELESMHADAAKAALAVFEQVHTPTDEALNQAWKEHVESEGYERDDPRAAFDSGYAAGFRRPVQGEPTDAREFLEAALAESDADEAEGGAGWDVEVDARTVLGLLDELSETQGEPTAEEWRASIVDERCRQFTKGYGVDHDRAHGVDYLLVWAQDYARRGEPLKSAALIEAARELLAVQGEPTAFDQRHADHEHVGPYCIPQTEPTPEPRFKVGDRVTNGAVVFAVTGVSGYRPHPRMPEEYRFYYVGDEPYVRCGVWEQYLEPAAAAAQGGESRG